MNPVVLSFVSVCDTWGERATSASELQITTSGAVSGPGRGKFYLGIREEELSIHLVFE